MFRAMVSDVQVVIEIFKLMRKFLIKDTKLAIEIQIKESESHTRYYLTRSVRTECIQIT